MRHNCSTSISRRGAPASVLGFVALAGQLSLTGNLTLTQYPHPCLNCPPPCPVNRTEFGSGTLNGWVPAPPNPPAPFSFPLPSIYLTGTQVFCPSESANNGTYTDTLLGAVNIVATPTSGGYTLSTDTQYVPNCGG